MARVQIDHLLRGEVEIAEQIRRAAFGSDESRVRDMERCLALQPDGWFLARLDGRPAGIVGITSYGPLAYVGMMAVHPEFQRRGIGETLLRRALAWAEDRRVPSVLLDATDAGVPLYVRHGFVVEDQVTLYARPGHAPVPVAPPTVRQWELRDLDAAAAFDETVFGASRRALFGLMLADFPGRAFVSCGADGRIRGLLVAQTRRIGPWVADDVDHASALLRAALGLAYDGDPIVMVPAANSAAAPLLARAGYTAVRTTRHMRRGRPVALRRRDLVFGQTSFTLG